MSQLKKEPHSTGGRAGLTDRVIVAPGPLFVWIGGGGKENQGLPAPNMEIVACSRRHWLLQQARGRRRAKKWSEILV